MPPRSPFPLFSTPSDTRTATLQGLLITALVITGLYVGRDVLLPLALSILLAFVLTPPLLLLRRIKVPRVLAVVTVVTIAFAIIFGLGWLLSREVTHLAGQLPTYRDALSAKIAVLRESTQSSPVFQQAGEILIDLQNQLVQPDKGTPAPEVGTQKPIALTTSRSRSKSWNARTDALLSDGSPARCYRRSPPPASCSCSSWSSCCSGRICATGSSGSSAPRTCSARPRR